MATRSSPRRRTVGGLVLFHGAGGDRDHRLFLELERRLPIPVARINFPYRDKGLGRRPPDRMPVLIETVERSVADAAAQWGIRPWRVAVGGRSMGGRAASMAVADGLDAAALILLSYPLHPPGKPDRLRVDHFDRIERPVLLVQGRKDPFGTPAEFAEHLPAVAGPVTERWVDGNHDPRPSRDDEIVEAVGSFLRGPLPG
ncbi:MAG: alpha/beta family hydrolase [Actinomycetota bacterium]